MKVVLSLAFDEGDDREADYVLHFVNGEAVILSHAVSQAVVDGDVFDAEMQIPGGVGGPER
jgi:hypothetical protein